MTLYDQLEKAALDSGETAGATINGHLVACVIADDVYGFVINGVPVSPEFARAFLEAHS
jgi:hypothetical protein